ncbi:MAG: hypothetical protein GC168_07185 [Candidatus Hydrogenedens sp.]|nr:hypothetical protein [Candidatus Hydrogenedens sp.]
MARGWAIMCAVLGLVSSSANAASLVTNGTGGGPWESDSTWAGQTVPAPGDEVTVLSGDFVTVNTPLRIDGVLSVLGHLIATNTTVVLEGLLAIDTDASCDFEGCEVTVGTTGILRTDGRIAIRDPDKTTARINLINHGRLAVGPLGEFQNGAMLDNVGTLECRGTLHNTGQIENHGVFENGGTFRNEGVFAGNAPTQALPLGAWLGAAAATVLAALALTRLIRSRRGAILRA